MKGFDAHLILKGYERNVAQPGSQINVIPSNTEKFIAFQIGKLRFLDRLQFLNASLDSLVNTLPADAFRHRLVVTDRQIVCCSTHIQHIR